MRYESFRYEGKIKNLPFLFHIIVAFCCRLVYNVIAQVERSCMTIGQQIRNRMIELDMTITDLSKRINVNRSTVHRYLNDEVKPSARKIYQLERVLKIKLKGE